MESWKGRLFRKEKNKPQTDSAKKSGKERTSSSSSSETSPTSPREGKRSPRMVEGIKKQLSRLSPSSSHSSDSPRAQRKLGKFPQWSSFTFAPSSPAPDLPEMPKSQSEILSRIPDNENLAAYVSEITPKKIEDEPSFNTQSSDTNRTRSGSAPDQTNTECDSLDVSYKGWKCKQYSKGTTDPKARNKTLISKESQTRYEIPKTFTDLEAFALTQQTHLLTKEGDENFLGKGEFGQVFYGIKYESGDDSGTFVAIKKVRKEGLNRVSGVSRSAKGVMHAELDITAELIKQGVDIVPIHEMLQFKKNIYQVMPIYNLTVDDVVTYIKHQRCLPLEEKNISNEDLVFLALQIGFLLAKNLVQLHHLNTFHYDVKPSNCFLHISIDDEGQKTVKFALGDFGAALLLNKDKDLKLQVATATDGRFVPPESFSDEISRIKPSKRIILSERWRFGVTLLSLFYPDLFEEMLNWGTYYIAELKVNPTQKYKEKKAVYNELIDRIYETDSMCKRIPPLLLEKLKGFINSDWSARDKISLGTILSTLDSCIADNIESNHGALNNQEKFAELLIKVVEHKNLLKENKRAEKKHLEEMAMEKNGEKEYRPSPPTTPLRKLNHFSPKQRCESASTSSENVVLLPSPKSN